ncbi:Tad2p [Malassezia vespertilionis]|uniref:Tad2p n=1 Tax=Malassezia vespertilionis TaxID=2020962 RepID=A0A2N1JAH0_9BASI|nr:Tad2p [Malassezia vespertilionis]
MAATVGCAVYVPREEQSEEDLTWMQIALDMAQDAFDHGEVPVGCVFVQDSRAIAKGRNRTNELLNATRHAELEAIDEILQDQSPSDPDFGTRPHDGPPGDNPMLRTTLEYLRNNPPYASFGGYRREDAIMILRQFYLTENTKAPKPKTKARRVLKTSINPPGVSMHSPSTASHD